MLAHKTSLVHRRTMLLVQAAPIKHVPISESEGRINLRKYLGSPRNVNTNDYPQLTPGVLEKLCFESLGWFQNSKNPPPCLLAR